MTIRFSTCAWSAFCFATVAVTSGCAVIDSTSYMPPDHGPACDGPLGGYTLPKNIVTVTITESEAGKRLSRLIDVSSPQPIPDPRLSFCLNYLGSPLSEDGLAVSRTENGLLTRVYSKLTDKSKAIAGKVLDIVGVGLTGNPEFSGGLRSRKAKLGTGSTIASHQFDLFDRLEASRINTALTKLGYCVYIEGATFDFGIDPDYYCSAPERNVELAAPVRMAVKAPVLWVAQEPIPPQAASTGILYRPNLRYEMTIKRRLEPDLRGRWEVHETRQVEMPNAAPVFSLQIERSMFITRKTDVVFDRGTLLDVTVDKPSELAEFVDIPLQAVQAVFAIPAQVVQVKINRTNNEERLIKAQAALIQTIRNYKLDAQPQSLPLNDETFTRFNAVDPNRFANKTALPSFSDPTFSDRAAEVCAQHCGGLGGSGNPATCAQTCLSAAQQCLNERAEATADECYNRGIRAASK